MGDVDVQISFDATAASSAPDDGRIGRHEIESNIVARFQAVVAQRPSDVALAGNGRCWTFEQLDRRTDQVAEAIDERTPVGVGCVAYLVDHSPEMVICALAVLKADKAYLCIHPGLPPA